MISLVYFVLAVVGGVVVYKTVKASGLDGAWKTAKNNVEEFRLWVKSKIEA